MSKEGWSLENAREPVISPEMEGQVPKRAERLREPVTPPEMEGKVPRRQARFSDHYDGARVDLKEIQRIKEEIKGDLK